MNRITALLNREEADELDSLLEERVFEDGEILFNQGEPADGAYVVRSGHVDLELTVPGGDPVVVERTAPGGFLGEPALLRSGMRNLTGRAVGRVEAGFMGRLDFQALRHGFRPVSLHLMLEVARLAGMRLLVVSDAIAAAFGEAAAPCSEPPPPLGALEPPYAGFDPRPYLQFFPFFEEFSDRDCAALLDMTTLWEVPRGRRLVCRGQASDRCWVVVRGAVRALDPHRHPVAVLGPGHAFGQLAPLLGVPSIADCETREASVLLEVGPAAFRDLTRPTSRVAFRFTNALAVSLLTALSLANRTHARAELSRRTQRIP